MWQRVARLNFPTPDSILPTADSISLKRHTRIGASVPTQTNFGKDPEWGTLAREINKKARHMPLRQLFGRIPNVLTQLAPYRRSLNFPVEINPITSLS